MVQNPFVVSGVFGSDQASEFNEKIRDIRSGHELSCLCKDFPSLIGTAALKNGEGGPWPLRCLFDASPEADFADLMRTAGGGTARNMDPRQRAVRKVFPTDSLYAGVKQGFRVADANLTNTGPDAGHGGFKEGTGY